MKKKLLGSNFQLFQVVDRIYGFDGKHLACGQRGLCHVRSLKKSLFVGAGVNTVNVAGNVSNECHTERWDDRS